MDKFCELLFSHSYCRGKQHNSKSYSCNNKNMTAHPMSYKQRKGKQNGKKNWSPVSRAYFWATEVADMLRFQIPIVFSKPYSSVVFGFLASQKLLKLIVSLFHRQGWAKKPAQKKSNRQDHKKKKEKRSHKQNIWHLQWWKQPYTEKKTHQTFLYFVFLPLFITENCPPSFGRLGWSPFILYFSTCQICYHVVLITWKFS